MRGVGVGGWVKTLREKKERERARDRDRRVEK